MVSMAAHLPNNLRCSPTSAGAVPPNATCRNPPNREEPSTEVRASPLPFPLRLTPFERYMLVDERRGYAMTFIIDFVFAGNVDTEKFELAAQNALVLNPLLSARLHKRARLGFWKAGPAPTPAVMWVERTELSHLIRRNIDLTKESPFQIRAAHVKDGLILQTATHHAVADGIGVVQFVAQLVKEYHRLMDIGANAGRRNGTGSDAQKLGGRGDFEVHLPKPISRWAILRFAAGEAVRLFSRRVRRLESSSPMDRGDAQCMRTVRLPRSLGRSLQTFAKARGVSINDVVVAALFSAIRKWTNQAERRRGDASTVRSTRRWIRFVMPVNLRGRKDRRMPAANMIGYAFLDRRESDCGNGDSLLAGVAEEIDQIRRWSMAITFLDGVRLLDRVPGALYLATRWMQNSATIVCSNLGDLQRMFRRQLGLDAEKALELRSVAGAAPVRPGTAAALGIGQVGEEICLTLSRDTKRLSIKETDDLLRMLVDCITQRIGTEFNSATMEVHNGLADSLD